MISLLILSSICLLILPISDFVGLISRQVGLLSKFGLWSFNVIKASFSAVVLTLSSRFNFCTMDYVSCSMEDVAVWLTFL